MKRKFKLKRRANKGKWKAGARLNKKNKPRNSSRGGYRL